MARLLITILTFCAMSCSVHFPYEKVALPAKSDGEASVWLVAGELHSDLVVETAWLVRHGCRLPASVKGYKYLCFGWGDLVAYTERWGIDDIPNALFWESESIVQVVAFNTEVVPTFPSDTVVKARVPERNGKALANFLHHSFSYPEAGAESPITLRPAKWGHGYFIASPYSYYAPRMCNQWIATALMEAGIYTTKPSSTMSSHTLVKHLNKYNKLALSPLLR